MTEQLSEREALARYTWQAVEEQKRTRNLVLSEAIREGLAYQWDEAFLAIRRRAWENVQRAHAIALAKSVAEPLRELFPAKRSFLSRVLARFRRSK